MNSPKRRHYRVAPSRRVWFQFIAVVVLFLVLCGILSLFRTGFTGLDVHVTQPRVQRLIPPGLDLDGLQREQAVVIARQARELSRRAREIQRSRRWKNKDMSHVGSLPAQNGSAKEANLIYERTAEISMRREAVKSMAHRAWRAYSEYAWGMDELKPMSKKGVDLWGGFAVTLLDALDTLWLMGFHEEFRNATRWVNTSLRFDKGHTEQGPVSVFETGIRTLGGLLGAHALSNEDIYRIKAVEVGDRMLKAFKTKSGLPSRFVDLVTGELSFLEWTRPKRLTSLAEAGSIQLELRGLSFITGNSAYAEAGDKAMDTILALRRKDGLYPQFLDTETGKAENNGTGFGIGAFNDSFYEYLLKLWLQGGRTDVALRQAYDRAVQGIHDRMLHKYKEGVFVGKLADSGQQKASRMEHLACFLPGVLALGAATAHPGSEGEAKSDRDMATARELMKTCYRMYINTASGLSPDQVDFSLKPKDKTYHLRPEAVESMYVLHSLTGDKQYQDWAWDIWSAIEENCSADKYGGVGYGAMHDVTVVGQPPEDRMESFFLAETLKYLYLIFDGGCGRQCLVEGVFNTEAHHLPTVAANGETFKGRNFQIGVYEGKEPAGVHGGYREPAIRGGKAGG